MAAPSRLSTVPQHSRARSSFRLVGLATLVGVLTGASVILVHIVVNQMQVLALGFEAERQISLPGSASIPRIALALAVGAVLVGILSRILARYEQKEPIDAVEANALRGGVMSWTDGVAVVLPILASVGFGASVGIEAAVTQTGAVLASLLGRRWRLRRSDLRLMVGAGAAAAIAAAYHAPIAGMLYSYELILGSYSKRTLAPVGLAAIAAVVTVSLAEGTARPFELELGTRVIWSDYPSSFALGLVSGLAGIAVMLLVSALERVMKRLIRDDTLRRIVAGLVLTLLAMRFPAVLGSGHAAIDRSANGVISGSRALQLLGAKGLGSAVSLGGGYRGGLFSASLMIGALLGQAAAWAVSYVPGAPALHPSLCALICMAGVGASIIGSPLAMIFLVLETSGDFEATVVVAIGAVTSAFVTDRLFGYSFATWRFQQRGLAVESGHDIARLESTPIAEIVRPPKRALAVNARIDEVVRAVSAAGAKGAAVFTPEATFVGLIDPSLIEEVEAEPELPVVAADLVYATTPGITPQTSLADVLEVFRNSDRPTLAVLDAGNSRKLVGCVRARDAFQLASSILDAQRREDLGVGA